MQREATDRLRTAHLALAGVSLVAAVAVLVAALRPAAVFDLPQSLIVAGWVGQAAALVYLLATCAARAIRPNSPTRAYAPVLDAALFAVCVLALVRGVASRGLLVGLDVAIPAVATVSGLVLAGLIWERSAGIAKRAESERTGRLRGVAASVRTAAAIALIAVIGFVEAQALPHAADLETSAVVPQPPAAAAWAVTTSSPG